MFEKPAIKAIGSVENGEIKEFYIKIQQRNKCATIELKGKGAIKVPAIK